MKIQLPDKDLTKPIKGKRKKSTPRGLAKKAAWTSFSRYIRTRDCLRFMQDPERGICVTCKKEKPYKELQAGHFIGGRGNSVLFDERIVYSQCAHCNQKPPVGLGGNYVEYFVFMEKEWGREKIDEFRALKGKEVKYKLQDFIEIKLKYDRKYQELIENY